MGFQERLKNLVSKAEKTAAEHDDQIRQTIDKAEAALDQQTGGKYHDQIAKADVKADAYLDRLKSKPADPQPPDDPARTGDGPREV